MISNRRTLSQSETLTLGFQTNRTTELIAQIMGFQPALSQEHHCDGPKGQKQSRVGPIVWRK